MILFQAKKNGGSIFIVLGFLSVEGARFLNLFLGRRADGVFANEERMHGVDRTLTGNQPPRHDDGSHLPGLAVRSNCFFFSFFFD